MVLSGYMNGSCCNGYNPYMKVQNVMETWTIKDVMIISGIWTVQDFKVISNIWTVLDEMVINIRYMNC
jgi:hypothetical protein